MTALKLKIKKWKQKEEKAFTKKDLETKCVKRNYTFSIRKS